MATQLNTTHADGTQYKCFYPKSDFCTVFRAFCDTKNHDHISMIRKYIQNQGYEEMCKDIDKVCNNIETNGFN